MLRMIKSIFVLFLLGFFTQAQTTDSCKGWDAEEYFKTATLEGVTACLDTGVDLNARGDLGVTPLHRAARYTENPDVIKALLSAGAELEAKDELERTPLHLAAGDNENPDITKALIDAGANLETRGDDWGFTALHCAAAWNANPDVAKVLMDAGADINARNKKGNTPLEIAKWNNKNKAVIAVLRDGGARGKPQEEGGFLKTAAALLGGAAIMYAGKDAEDQESVARAVREYMKGVINEQPAGTINPAATSSQSQHGQDQLQQALLNLEKVCGEKYQGNFSVDDHARFYCLAAFNDYCALKRAKSSETISKLRASLQQNCTALKKDGLESKCPYCK